MCGPIDSLAAEVPAVQSDLSAAGWIGDLERLDLDAMRGCATFFPRIVTQCAEQTALSDLTLPNKY